MGLPVRQYLSGRRRGQLVGDRERIRAETGAEVDLNYVVTAGHLVKADDYPWETAAHRWIGRSADPQGHRRGDRHRHQPPEPGGRLAGRDAQGGDNVDPLDVFPVR